MTCLDPKLLLIAQCLWEKSTLPWTLLAQVFHGVDVTHLCINSSVERFADVGDYEENQLAACMQRILCDHQGSSLGPIATATALFDGCV